MDIVTWTPFTASAEWRGGQLVGASAPEKPKLDIATPPEFKGGIEGVWSPEELLVASAASCFALTLAGVGNRAGIQLDEIQVDGLGRVGRLPDGRFAFVGIELTVEAECECEHPHTLQRLVADAERRCIVGNALEVPISVRLVLASSSGIALSG